MIRFKDVAAALLALATLGACGNSGDEASPPPTGLQLTPGDGVVTVTWADDPAVNYWLFISSDSRLTTDNFTLLTDIHIVRSAVSPYVLCGNINGRTLYFALNGRTGNGPGGPGTATFGAPSRPAGSAWVLGSAPPADFNGLGYAGITTCTTVGLPAGLFVAVGAGGSIATSTDGSTFTAQVAPTGFNTDLFAVAGFASIPGDLTTPGLRLVAVGAGGGIVVSPDGVTWTTGVPFNVGSPSLRGVAVFAGVFVAVGDAGTTQNSADGITWTTHASGPTADLQGITCTTDRCVAVGDGGTIVVSVDAGVTWSAAAVPSTPALKKVAYGNFNNNVGSTTTAINTWVAVGDAGSVMYSIDGGATWSATSIAGAGDLVGIAYITQFIALDSAGNVFTSVDGQNWSGAVATGVTAQRGLVTTGVAYTTIGASGATASSH